MLQVDLSRLCASLELRSAISRKSETDAPRKYLSRINNTLFVTKLALKDSDEAEVCSGFIPWLLSRYGR